jgi:hypothetical protein
MKAVASMDVELTVEERNLVSILLIFVSAEILSD